MDRVVDPWRTLEPAQLFEVVEAEPDGAPVRLAIAGPSIQDGSPQSRTMAFDLGPRGADGEARFEAATNIPVQFLDGRVILDEPFNPRSFAGRTLQNLDFYDPDDPVILQAVEVEADQPPRELFYIPAFLLFGLVYLLQTRRFKVQALEKERRKSGEKAGARPEAQTA
jgi:hypothetical protein